MTSGGVSRRMQASRRRETHRLVCHSRMHAALIRDTLALSVELANLFLQLRYYQDAFSLFRRQVWQPAHTLGLKRVVARERAALFTDLPQMRVEH